jgi:DNA-binding transcriptional ArsR family regulator
MSQIRFEVPDVAGLRFRISPLWETVRSLYALADPGRHPVHLPWIRRARTLARDPAVAGHVALLSAFARPGAWMPDFLTPPPRGPRPGLAEELEVLLCTPPERVVADLTAVAGRRPLPPAALAAMRDPASALPALAAAVRGWHDAAIAPYWGRLQAALEADIAVRSRRLAEGGPRRLLDTLHPTVRWAGDRLVCRDPWGLDLRLGGRGLPLVPSVFVDRRVLWTVRADSPPLAVYPARALAGLWDPPRRRQGAEPLAAVVGGTRARLLALLTSPATTTELAGRLGLSPAAVSEHLRALRAANLVARSPHGRTVLYLTTPLGTALLNGR